MNEKDFVSLIVARKLKEKEFDEYCKALYINGKWRDISCKNTLDMFKGKFYAAPTLYDAQKWLREKHMLHVNADYDNELRCWFYSVLGIDRERNIDMINTEPYKSYEEALNEGILRALTLIRL